MHSLVETVTFDPTVDVPDPGDNRSAASVDGFAQQLANRTRYLLNHSRSGQIDITRTPYGADPTGASVATIPIQNAINDAAVSGAVVFVPPGVYQHGALTIPDGVSIEGIPNRSFLMFNHASANDLVFTGSNDGTPSVISDIRFISNSTSAGFFVVNNADAKVQFVRCSINGFAPGGGPSNNFVGPLARVNSASSLIEFIDCQIGMAGNTHGLYASSGKIRVVRGVVSMPAVYSDGLGYVDSTGEVTFDDVRFDLNAHSGGTAEALYVTSTTGRGAVRNCTFEATGALGTIYGFLWVQDARVEARGNTFIGTAVTPYGNNRAALGSHVELEPTLAIDIGSAPTVNLGALARYKSILVKGTAACVVTLPVGIVPGQELLYTHYNADVSGHNITFSITGFTGSSIPNPVGPGNTLSTVLVWESRDVSSAYRWVQKGDWGTGLTIV